MNTWYGDRTRRRPWESKDGGRSRSRIRRRRRAMLPIRPPPSIRVLCVHYRQAGGREEEQRARVNRSRWIVHSGWPGQPFLGDYSIEMGRRNCLRGTGSAPRHRQKTFLFGRSLESKGSRYTQKRSTQARSDWDHHSPIFLKVNQLQRGPEALCRRWRGPVRLRPCAGDGDPPERAPPLSTGSATCSVVSALLF